MKNYRVRKHEINSITEICLYCLNNLRNFKIKYKLGAILSIILILIITCLFLKNKEGFNSMELSQNSIINIEIPEFAEINLSQITKNNDGVFMVGYDIIPGIYRAELTDTVNMGYVVKYNNAAMGADDIIAEYTFEKDGYFVVEDSDLVVALQGVKITLQQNFYLFGF